MLDVGRSPVSELQIDTLLGQALKAAKDLTGAGDAVLDRHDHRGFPPTEGPCVGVPIQVRGETFGTLYVTEKEGGGRFDERDEAMLLVLADWTAVAIDNARLYAEGERRRRELERAVLALEATVSLARASAVDTDSGPLTELIVERGRALVRSRSLVLLSPDPHPAMTVLAMAGDDPLGPGACVFPGRDLDLGKGRSTRQVERVSGELLKVRGGAALASESALVARLNHHGNDQGYLLALDADEREGFTADDELLLESFSSGAASALASSRGAERDRLRRAIDASEREQHRWAMELHDETLQDLGALKLIHEGALRAGDPGTMRKSLADAAAQLEVTIASLESLIHELRPAVLDALGVGAAIETLAGRTGQRVGLEIRTHIDLPHETATPAERLSPQLESTIYRVVQESLNNTAKHAGASRAWVSVSGSQGQVIVLVEDDGSGFDPGEAGGDRFGLHGMRERVELADGHLRIDSSPGKGTRVEAELPFDPAPEDDPL